MVPLAAVCVVVGFVAGVVFHKWVISEAEAVKQHVSSEIAAWRVDVARMISKA